MFDFMHRDYGSLVVEEIYRSERMECRVNEQIMEEEFPCADCCLKSVCATSNLACFAFSVYTDSERNRGSKVQQKDWSQFARLPSGDLYSKLFPRETLECPNCRERFIRTDHRQKFCSAGCRRSYTKRRK
jgi:hypothetical protein